MRRAIMASAALAMLATVLTVGGALTPPAGAITAGSYHELVNKAAFTTCLDGTANAKNGTPLQQWGCWNGPQQRWKFVPSPTVSGAYEIQSANSPYLCLDGTSSPTSTTVQQWGCWMGPQQLWVPFGNLLVNYNTAKNGTARCLQVVDRNTYIFDPLARAYQGGPVNMGPCTNAALQQWAQV